MSSNSLRVLKDVDFERVIERIAAGEFPKHIADEIGVHHSNLYRQLNRHPDYRISREIAWEYRLDKATEDIEQSDERTLPRAREVFRAVSWRAEREFPERWGGKSLTVNINQGVSMEAALELAASTLLDRITGRVIDQSPATPGPDSQISNTEPVIGETDEPHPPV